MAVVLVVIVIVIALLIHGCDVSQTNGSLETYAGHVSTWVTRSNNNGAAMFADLTSGEAKSDLESLQGKLDNVLGEARTGLRHVEGLSVPSQMDAAQQSLVQTMRLRYYGIRTVAAQVQDAMTTSTSKDAVQQITVGMYMLAGSDVDYKALTGPAIVAALRKANIQVGGTSGVPIAAGQILGDLGWLKPANVATWLGAQLPSSEANGPCPGLCGHLLNYVTIGGQELSSVSPNTIPASTKPTFVLNFTNGGHSNEYQVGCEVWVKGLHDRGKTVYPETVPNSTYNCDVTLPTALSAGTYTIHARIDRVPGEVNMKDNVLSFTVIVN
ncbi:MAG: hypothetical protein ACRDKL_10680 [Solirubrobacteraceae bacterium]